MSSDAETSLCTQEASETSSTVLMGAHDSFLLPGLGFPHAGPAVSWPAVRALFIVIAVLLIPSVASAQADQAEVPPIDVIDVSGPIDELGAEFIIGAITAAHDDGAQAVILQIDSPGAVDESIREVIEIVASPPLPVIAWIGDAPATARGGALDMAAAASLTLAAPGVEIGYSSPLIVGGDAPGASGFETLVVVSEPGGPVDGLEPALGGLIVSLDGMQFTVAGSIVALDTAVEVTDDDGNIRRQVAPQVRFQEPGLLTRTMRLALQPEAIFFFLVAGLSLVVFEFYAIGPGVAAATAALPLLLAGYGLVVLPVGWGFWLVLLCIWLLASDYQRGGFGVLSYAASIVLPVGGWFIVDTRPQIEQSVWSVIVIALGVMLFFMFAMPTVARSRFTTPTMGREYLIGKEGRAVTDAVAGVLTVEVDGASWHGTTFRESSIVAGSPVTVQAIQGLYLEVVELVEVDPDREEDRENKSEQLE